MRRAALALLCSGCVGTTGYDLVEFDAAVAGPPGGDGSSLSFETSRGYEVTLTEARLHVGAIYLNRSLPQAGIQETSCTLPGTYVAQVTTGGDFDLLSPEPQPFPERGLGSATPALSGEAWLMGGAIDAEEDSTPIFRFEGLAARGAETFPFTGEITIGQNRAIPPADPVTQPGSNPICKQRIVTPIPTDVVPAGDGALVLRADPAEMFDLVEFASLAEGGAPAPYAFVDALEGQPAVSLFQGLHRASSAWWFEWIP